MIKRIILPICILLGFIVLMCLGTWQVLRLQQKEALIERVERQLEADPIFIDEAIKLSASKQDIEYRPVMVTGKFIPDTIRRYFISREGNLGYYLYQALLMDGDRVIWVNLGFVPDKLPLANIVPKGTMGSKDSSGIVQFAGLLRQDLTQKPNGFVPNNAIVKNLYYWKNIAAFSQPFKDTQLKDKTILPFFVDAGVHEHDQVWQNKWPKSGITRVEFTNNHLQYAVTWYGLALACLGVGFAFWRSRSKNDK
jgi:surfeit locus 1 family protein